MHLTIHQPVATSFFDTACSSYTWNNVEYTASGAYTHTLSNVAGCDSTVTLRLTIKQPVTSTFNAVACDSYQWNDSVYTEGGAYRQTFTAANGCDSVVTLILTMHYSTTGDTVATACESFDWYEHTGITASTEALTHVFNTVYGCDSTVTLHLTVNHATTGDTTAVACESFEWYGVTYTETPAVAPTHVYTNVAGCDSTVTLHLTINHSTTGDTTAVACESFDWYEHTGITASTEELTHVFASVAGCDSTVTLHLTINHATTGDTTAMACESFEWYGVTYTETPAVAPTHVFTAANGCDSTVTLHLTINHATTGDTIARACDSFDWYEHTGITASTEALTHVFTSVYGCDSTVTLHLTVNYSTESSFDTMAYGSYVWNNETYTTSGTYEQTLATVNGCDSTVTMNLVVIPDGFVMPYLYNLMDVVLSVNHNEPGHEDVHYIYYRWYRDGELVLEGPDYDSYNEGGNRLNGCYYLEVALDESLEYWVRSNTVCISNVGIDEAEALTFTLAPNPVVSGSTVTLTTEADNIDFQGAVINVYDVNGHEVLVQKDDAKIVANLASGMYIVRLTLSDGRTAVKRMIVR